MSILTTLFLISWTPAEPDLCPLVADLNVVVTQETGYAPPPCPSIGFAALATAGALRSIELASDPDLTDAFGQSYLLHELVHAAQYANGAQTTVRCPAMLEAEAYTVQSDFLRARGFGREAVIMRLLAVQLGTCTPE